MDILSHCGDRQRHRTCQKISETHQNHLTTSGSNFVQFCDEKWTLSLTAMTGRATEAASRFHRLTKTISQRPAAILSSFATKSGPYLRLRRPAEPSRLPEYFRNSPKPSHDVRQQFCPVLRWKVNLISHCDDWQSHRGCQNISETHQNHLTTSGNNFVQFCDEKWTLSLTATTGRATEAARIFQKLTKTISRRPATILSSFAMKSEPYLSLRRPAEPPRLPEYFRNSPKPSHDVRQQFCQVLRRKVDLISHWDDRQSHRGCQKISESHGQEKVKTNEPKSAHVLDCVDFRTCIGWIFGSNSILLHQSCSSTPIWSSPVEKYHFLSSTFQHKNRSKLMSESKKTIPRSLGRGRQAPILDWEVGNLPHLEVLSELRLISSALFLSRQWIWQTQWNSQQSGAASGSWRMVMPLDSLTVCGNHIPENIFMILENYTVRDFEICFKFLKKTFRFGSSIFRIKKWFIFHCLRLLHPEVCFEGSWREVCCFGDGVFRFWLFGSHFQSCFLSTVPFIFRHTKSILAW